ncbi:hypothetical protein CASFOL_037199 [Castilleja foliolosa]|uniref:Loganate O-methyltransferase n=1 Tax=Castilleja foliolosa TaxID=1961234 RepID=A0ABD3BPQ3_9LAMI
MDKAKLKEAASCKYHMMGGDGPNSYAHNSNYQRQLLVSAEDLIHELINEHLDTSFNNPHNTIRIADFGCSVGPNTFFAVQNIISAVENKYKSDDHFTPEFQVFFNDLIDNDFNTLFRNLATNIKNNYFFSGSPGSFHARLFPKRTIHFAHCSTALHWLSRVPERVLERDSDAWNKGNIHYSGGGKEVKEAYWGQYKKDMGDFLRARADEVVEGGLMVLLILGFPDGELLSQSSIGVAFQILGSCLQDMAKMGKISEEKVDSFNLPFYYPSLSELKASIETNGMFDIARMSNLGGPMRRKPDPRVLTSHLRAVTGILIEQHFGNGTMIDELFKLHYEKLVESPILVDDKYYKETNYFVFLKRKP